MVSEAATLITARIGSRAARGAFTVREHRASAPAMRGSRALTRPAARRALRTVAHMFYKTPVDT
ncbi:hypothetical protein Airi02_048660 [Actinoallomurus iriomotensis]|uniref:Uncharacterized protein n=1 Tax=Actinoallomurus iriomotensis TaxID=478107 RepID=A0A9W6S749_9ACTN|nr:hypothetical protein Airi02_048660 [Actinoallomurus iriomotensis]